MRSGLPWLPSGTGVAGAAVQRALRDRGLGGFLFGDAIRAAGQQQDQAEQQGQDQSCFV